MNYDFHFFICTNERPPGNPKGCCKSKNSEALIEVFKKEVAAVGKSQKVRVQKSGCLGVCGSGPSLVVYPEGSWYGKIQPSDVQEIVQSHIQEGKPVERFLIPSK